MTCLIVDDNPLARTALRQMVSGVPFLQIEGEFEDALEAWSFLQNQPVDLLLLDIEMPGMTGLEFLQTITVRPLAILITSRKEYAVEAFDLNVVDYLVKPVALPRFVVAMQRAKELFDGKMQTLGTTTTSKDAIFVRSNHVLLKILFDDILWVQALGDYVVFQTTVKKHAVHSTMKQVEEKLPSDKFIRIHRSYIVALEKIESIEDGNKAYIQKQSVPIGENYKANLLKLLNLL